MISGNQHKSNLPSDKEISARKSVSDSSMSADLELVASGPPMTFSEEKAATTTNPQDPYLIDWDGESDPKNPMNWSKSSRYTHVAIVSAITMIT